jgi:hypothetical protein
VKGQSSCVAAERVRENDVGTRFGESTVNVCNQSGTLDVEQLGTPTSLEPEREQGGAHGTIGDQHALRRQCLGEFRNTHRFLRSSVFVPTDRLWKRSDRRSGSAGRSSDRRFSCICHAPSKLTIKSAHQSLYSCVSSVAGA